MNENIEDIINTGTREILSSERAALFIWENKDGWPVRYVSESIRQVLGYEPEDFLSGKVVYTDIVSPDQIERVKDEVINNVQSGEKICVHEDYKIKHKDGHYVWIYDSTYIKRDPSGEVSCFIGYIFDMSQHYQTLLELEEQKERFRLVLDASNLGLWDWNPQSNKVIFNDKWANILGYDLSDMENNYDSWSEKVHPDDINSCIDAIHTKMANGYIF
jgi:PAS domain S-box-containing protein